MGVNDGYSLSQIECSNESLKSTSKNEGIVDCAKRMMRAYVRQYETFGLTDIFVIGSSIAISYLWYRHTEKQPVSVNGK